MTKQQSPAKNGGKLLKKIWFAPIFVICLSLVGCKGSATNYPVDFIDRNAAFSLNKKSNPLILVVEIDEAGNLRLNKIETGTIADVSLLTENLKVIFDDREKTSIKEREVVIDPQGKIKNEDLEKLIENLADVKASPIRAIKNNL